MDEADFHVPANQLGEDAQKGDEIYRAGKITFEEINVRWRRTEMSGGEDIPLRTFHNHRKAIEEMFDINIECDKRDGYRYFIENAEDMQKGGVRNWLLNTFAVNNLINESHHLKRRILFEDIPSGRKYLTPLIEAMRNNAVVEMTYQGYWRAEPHTFEVEPYCVKVFRQDFRQELLSHGDEIEVLDPQWFRKEMKHIADKMHEYYKR